MIFHVHMCSHCPELEDPGSHKKLHAHWFVSPEVSLMLPVFLLPIVIVVLYSSPGCSFFSPWFNSLISRDAHRLTECALNNSHLLRTHSRLQILVTSCHSMLFPCRVLRTSTIYVGWEGQTLEFETCRPRTITIEVLLDYYKHLSPHPLKLWNGDVKVGDSSRILCQHNTCV